MPLLGLSAIMSNRKPSLTVLELLKAREETLLTRVIEELSPSEIQEWKGEIAAIETTIRLLSEDIERQEEIEEIKRG